MRVPVDRQQRTERHAYSRGQHAARRRGSMRIRIDVKTCTQTAGADGLESRDEGHRDTAVCSYVNLSAVIKADALPPA
jgi:hypothetical protein